MAKNRMAVVGLEMRLMAAEAMVDGADYEGVRRLLAENGVDEADLPSDLTLKNYREGEEYGRYYKERMQAITLPRRMAELAAMGQSVETMIEMSAMQQLLLRMDAGELETAHMLKLLTIIQRRRALQLREATDARAAANSGVAGDDVTRAQKKMPLASVMAGMPGDLLQPDEREDDGDPGNVGYARDDADSAAGMEAAALEQAVNPSKTDQIGVKPGILAAAKFRNSPSASSRSKARKKRKKAGR